MWSDPIVDEVRAEAKQWTQQFSGDVRAMFAELKRLEQQSSEQAVRLPPRPAIQQGAVVVPFPTTGEVSTSPNVK